MGFPKRNSEIKWNCLDAPNWNPKLIRLLSSVWGQKPLFFTGNDFPIDKGEKKEAKINSLSSTSFLYLAVKKKEEGGAPVSRTTHSGTNVRHIFLKKEKLRATLVT